MLPMNWRMANKQLGFWIFVVVLRALFSSLVAIRRILMFLLNAKQIGLVNCLCGQGVRDVVRHGGLIRYL